MPDMTNEELCIHKQSHTKENSWWLLDDQGIECSRVCDECEEAVMAQYRPEIFSGYDQSDVDEPIEGDDDFGDFDYTSEFGDNYE